MSFSADTVPRVRYVHADTRKPISKIGLGTHQFGSPEWNYGERYASSESHAIVRRALDLGVTLFDSAEIYGINARSLSCRALVHGVAVADSARISGFGRSERILGEALMPDAASAVVATKFYPARPVSPPVRRHAIASARRLGIPAIDLYQIHQPPRPHVGRAVIDAVRDLHAEGLVTDVGLSNGTVAGWRAADDALGVPVLSNQVAYSLVDRAAEQTLLPYARSEGRVIIAFSPLAQGLLSARYDRARRPADPGRMTNPLFLPENLDRAAGLLETLQAVADAHHASPAQIALAWVIHDPVVTAIPGAATVAQLESNVAAADIDLTEEEYRALSAAAAAFSPVAPPARSPADRVRRRVASWLGG
jgi:aryl-alcohol dehydrogenase-like predicted oxidoreductase